MTKDDIRKEEGSQGLKVKTRKHVKIRPSQIDKKQGNLKRFDIVGCWSSNVLQKGGLNAILINSNLNSTTNSIFVYVSI